MCIQELSTCMQYNLPIKIVILNNRYLGMVRQWQEFFYDSRYAESYMDALPDFVKLAEAYGHVGMRIEQAGGRGGRAEGGARKLKDRLVFLDFITDQTENVFPMVPGGKGLTEMILLPEELRPIACAISFPSCVENEAGALSRVAGPVLRARLQHRVAHRGADRGRRRCRA